MTLLAGKKIWAKNKPKLQSKKGSGGKLAGRILRVHRIHEIIQMESNVGKSLHIAIKVHHKIPTGLVKLWSLLLKSHYLNFISDSPPPNVAIVEMVRFCYYEMWCWLPAWLVSKRGWTNLCKSPIYVSHITINDYQPL